MPGSITHLMAAYYYNKLHGMTLGPDFYLGSISPDSVNVLGHASKEKRWSTHLRNQDLDIWTDNVKSFYDENKLKVNNDFLKGYVIHILTDIVWDRKYDSLLYRFLLLSGVDKDRLKDERWAEIYGYEQTQINSDWLNTEVLPKLKCANLVSVFNLDDIQVQRWKHKILSKDLPIGREISYLNDEIMLDFYKNISLEAEKIFNI